MAGTATNYDTTTIRAGSKGQIWANLAIPGAGAKLVLATDGTPDATANPSAIHLGMTRAGSTLSLKSSGETDFFSDEQTVAVHSIPGNVEASISAELLQVLDMDLMQVLTPTTGTAYAGTGYEGITFGDKAVSYSSVAVIFPVQGSTTQFAVWHLYKTYNTEGIGFTIDAKGMSGTTVTFKGFGITTRAAADTTGAYWKQIS